jgi:predicted dehydrogenase
MDVGVIGVGIMGKNHVRVYSELKQVANVYIYDVNTDAAKGVALANEATSCSTLPDLLKNVDAVSVCVPTPYHREIGEQVLSAGVHMLMEKPMCANEKDAGDLLRLIGEDLIVGVGHIERFNPIVTEIRRIIRRPLFVEINRHNPASSRPMEASVIEDLMIHDIDILIHLLFNDNFKLVAAGSLDVTGVLFKFDSVSAFLSASRKSSKKIRRIYIEEEELTIEGDFMNQEIYTYFKPENYRVEKERYVQENIIEKVMVNKIEPLKVELQTFLDCVIKRKPFPVTPEQAIKNLTVCEQVRVALQEK